MNPLYNLGIRAYATAARVAATRSAKVRQMLDGQRQTATEIGTKGYDAWFHAASLGEFEQLRPLIERYRAKYPSKRLLLTFFSPSGYNVRKNYDQVDAVAYLPFDTPARARQLVEQVNPQLAVFAKYEFWGNYLEALHARRVPTYIISAIFRPTQIFFKPWGGMMRRVLRCYDRLFVQDNASAQLLASIGIDNVTVAGDTRFDRVAHIRQNARQFPQLKGWSSSAPMTLVVGSSWPADEALYVPWLNAHPQVKAVIAPHEFDDQRLAALQKQLAGKSVLFSQLVEGQEIGGEVQTVIIDCFGLLSSLYGLADAAIIGGGLGAGIHNINEAAVYGIPVAFGPRHQKFKEAGDMIKAGAANTYADAAQCAAILDGWLNDPEGRKNSGRAAETYIQASLGATDRIARFIL